MQRGVSASAYDWAMVPFVRKSFFKHYVLNYIKLNSPIDFEQIWKMSNGEIDEWIKENKEKYLGEFNLKFEDFGFDNIKKLDSHIGGLALLDTKIETFQAAEALIHNLKYQGNISVMLY